MKRKFPLYLIDVFTETPLEGNPCAVVLEADSLSSEEMLKISKEMNQSETAFILKSKNYSLKARYFTPEREIPLAGHPTIATIFSALEMGMLKKSTGTIQKIQLELNDGPIFIEIKYINEQPLIKMFQRKPKFLEIHDPKIVLPLFSLSLNDLLPGAVIQTVSTGTPQLMIPVKSIEILKRVSLNIDSYKIYREQKNFFSPHLFCLEGISKEASTFARHLGVFPDTSEDAFTGSATGAMAAYLFHYGYIKQKQFIAEQGHLMNRPGQAHVSIVGIPDKIESVAIEGRAVMVMKGEFCL